MTVERPRWRWRGKRYRSRQDPCERGVTPQNLNAAIEALRKGRTADSASAENAYDALKKYARDLTQAAREGKIDPVIGRDEEIVAPSRCSRAAPRTTRF